MGVLDGRVAIITGAARGQGEATARLFIDEGASVVITDVNFAAVTALAKSLGNKARGIEHDISDEGGWAKVVDCALTTFGAIDILINNAAIHPYGGIDVAQAADMSRAFQVNVVGAFLGMKYAAPHMLNGRGSIVNISSGGGLHGVKGLVAYSTSKWALRGLSRSVALDLAPAGIRVNVICPGVIDTPMIKEDAPAGHFETYKQGIPLGRVGIPIDIAHGSLFLASDASAFMTGSEMIIDGGRSA